MAKYVVKYLVEVYVSGGQFDTKTKTAPRTEIMELAEDELTNEIILGKVKGNIYGVGKPHTLVDITKLL